MWPLIDVHKHSWLCRYKQQSLFLTVLRPTRRPCQIVIHSRRDQAQPTFVNHRWSSSISLSADAQNSLPSLCLTESIFHSQQTAHPHKGDTSQAYLDKKATPGEKEKNVLKAFPRLPFLLVAWAGRAIAWRELCWAYEVINYIGVNWVGWWGFGNWARSNRTLLLQKKPAECQEDKLRLTLICES